MVARIAICCGNSVMVKVAGFVEWSTTILPMLGMIIARSKNASNNAIVTLILPIFGAGVFMMCECGLTPVKRAIAGLLM